MNDPDSAQRQFDTRSFHYHWDDDASLVFDGRLPAEVGAMFLKSLQASIDRKESKVSAVTHPLSKRLVSGFIESGRSFEGNPPFGSGR